AYTADIEAARASYVLFKMTWHPNWHALVDGKPVKTAMLSPGFLGVPVNGGRHHVELRYQPEAWRWILAILGAIAALIALAAEHRDRLPRIAFAPTFADARWLRPVGLIALSIPVCMALATSALPGGHDATEYLPRLVEFHQNIIHGILLPRWAPDLSHGTGQPLFLFNPPMIYYLAEFWHLIGLNFVTALNAACASIVLASAAAMFLLGKLYFGEMGGWLAASAYLYAPYFAVNLYVRSAMAEFAAFPFFALALYGFGAYTKRRKRAYLALGAAAYAGVLLCHNPAALLFSPLLGAFILFTSWNEKSWKIFRHQACGVVLGLALAAFVWAPSMLLNSTIQVRALFNGYTAYTNHFVYLHQLFDSSWGYGLSIAGDKDGMSFALGFGQLAIALIASIWALRHRNKFVRRWLLFFGIASAALCFMILQAAAPLWGYLRPLQYIEFPWRWLGPIALAMAAMAAAFAPMLRSLGRWKNLAFVGAMALLIVPDLGHLHFDRVQDLDLTFWTPQEIAERGIEVSSLGEYRPRWMQTTPPYDPRPAEVVSGYAQIRQLGRKPVAWSGRVQANRPATIEMQIAYFPGWEVHIDGAPAAVQPSQNTGLLRFQTPPGDHIVSVIWKRTPAIWAGDLVSILAFLILIYIIAAGGAGSEGLPARVRGTRIMMNASTSKIAAPTL
ncbi:MAG: YfhO family protein, partial [Bryobacteraceae bacterium]